MTGRHVDRNDWRQMAINATHDPNTGEPSQLGAIIRAVTRTELKMPAPKFIGQASITSDGFVLCGFQGRDGQYRGGAFVGSFADLVTNWRGLADYLQSQGMKDEQREAMFKALRDWIHVDYRSQQMKDAHEKLLTARQI